MGKGCDIIFNVNGEKIRLESDLSINDMTYENISKILMSNKDVKELLISSFMHTSSISNVDVTLLEEGNFVPNATIKVLVDRYPDLDWNNVDLSTKILAAKRCVYYNDDISNTIIYQKQGNTINKVIIIDPTNPSLVRTLHNYLQLLNTLNLYKEGNQSPEVEEILKNSDIDIILEELPKIVERKVFIKNEYDYLVKTKGSKKEILRYESRLAAIDSLETILKNKLDPIDLLISYLNHHNVYQFLLYDKNSKSVVDELDKVLKQLQGKSVLNFPYKDIFAQQIRYRSKWDPETKTFHLSVSNFEEIVQNKLESLSRTEGDRELINALRKFLNSEKSGRFKEVFNALVKSTDEEFSYEFDSVKGNTIFLKGVPLTLEDRYSGFIVLSKDFVSPSEYYRGYTIYEHPNGYYYVARHVLTGNVYGTRYNSVEACKNYIDKLIHYNPIAKSSLIEIKTRGEKNVIYTPDHYLPGQIIKSLKIELNPKIYGKMNSLDQKFLYTYSDNNNLEGFYEYVLKITTFQSEYEKLNLMRTVRLLIDTAEKAACFLYMINDLNKNNKFGRINNLSLLDLTKVLDDIGKLDYEYFIVESASNPAILNNTGFPIYSEINGRRKGVSRVLLTPVSKSKVTNGLLEGYTSTERSKPSIQILEAIALKIKDKFNIDILIKSLSEIDEILERNNIEIPSEVHGFILTDVGDDTAKIYINSSNATSDDLFHEYTHILLGILKSKNVDNYHILVDYVANTLRGKNLKINLRKKYKNLADSDLNEEVFATIFGQYLSERKHPNNPLHSVLDMAVLDINSKIPAIFGTEVLSLETLSLNLVCSLFDNDIHKMVLSENGLEIQNLAVNRLATNWIESQIAKYKDNNETGIEEICN